MTKFNPPINKPLDRDYFKKKDNPKYNKKGPQLTECCDQDIDYDCMNVNDLEDWELIEDYIERHLIEYSSTKSITPVSCVECGRFLEYVSTIYDGRQKYGKTSL